MQMADQIVLRSVESLIPYARNARTHSDAQVAQIAGSIREFGFTNPVLVDGKNGIVAGHGRVLAARKLGLTEVPCIELAHLSAAQRRAYIIADNTDGLTDPDDVPPPPEHPVSQPGELWLLGRHRLLCGESTVATDVERVL